MTKTTPAPAYDAQRAAEIRPRLTFRHHDRPLRYDNGQLRRLAAVAFPSDAGNYWLTAQGLTPAARALCADLYASDDLACRRREEVRRRANGRPITLIGETTLRADPCGTKPLMPTLTPAERALVDKELLARLMAKVEAGAADRPGHAARLVARALTVAPASLVAEVADALRAQAVMEAENKVAARAILAAIEAAVAAAMPTPTPVVEPEPEKPTWGSRASHFLKF